MNTIVTFIVVLGVLIIVHEFGHFLFAKLFGVQVLKFSLGFGPKVFGKTIGETEYLLSAFPLGGYVKMLGENADEQDFAPELQKKAFSHKPVLQRLCIVLAGPLFNLLFSIVLFFGIYSVIGLPTVVDSTRVGKVSDKSPAMVAGIEPGDTILQISGRDTKVWADVLNSVKESSGQQLSILLQRGSEKVEIHVTPSVESAKNIFGE